MPIAGEHAGILQDCQHPGGHQGLALRAIQLYTLRLLIKNARWLEAIRLAEEHFVDFVLKELSSCLHQIQDGSLGVCFGVLFGRIVSCIQCIQAICPQ